ncbi:uncharacterized protein BHQ10_005377 [Talaromyces amestolkiae]|uniref:amidase n=1 Tax=Talaromyces amestolkiae TaxID=1196081 RepID=A0A364L0P3_TALAM|nr:uncharacterized protein BHQ10_005377 [Talaromyces amestolkiae]RAO69365.1 hypothetical protein BHQ10_005377 [Talaromyces amestolkiae]
MAGKPWQEIAQIAQEVRDKSIAQVQPPVPDVPEDLPLNVTSIPKKLLTPREIEITETAPEILVQKLATGEWKCVEVTNSFLRRAGLAQRLVNCVTELMPEEALERAKYLDDYLAKHGKPIGPLHGLPVSIKEHLPMKGRTINCGYVAWWGRISEVTYSGTEVLYNAGAVLYVRTTQPQSLMHLATSSNLYGETVCPYNRQLTSGGSSGGEGALIGMRGSAVGIGTDIGGSIRSPAANCGIYGLRPTSSRFPYDKFAAAHGPQGIPAVAGPLSTSRGGLRLIMKAAIDSKPWLKEPTLLPIPWRDDVSHLTQGTSGKKLKIGVLWDDGVVKPHPPVTRALNEVVSKLRDVPGVEIVDWKPYKHDYAWERIASLYYADGGADNLEIFAQGGEPLMPLTHFILTENEHRKRLQIEEIWDLMEKNIQYKTEYANVWNKTATGVDERGIPTGMVDVILSPTGPGAAPPLDQAKYWGYTAQWNLLDYPAAVFPVTQVQPEVDKKEEAYEPRNSKDEFNYKLYEPELYRDAPVSLQLIGRPCEDEKVLEALDFIHDHVSLPSFK